MMSLDIPLLLEGGRGGREEISSSSHLPNQKIDIVTLVPDEEEFPCMCGQEDQTVKEAWEGRSPAE